MNNGHVKIFDTTLRDGEQAPGCSMTLGEKLKISRALTDLNVDIIEAGFPAASPGDFNSVKEIADQNLGPIICGLARCNEDDINKAGAIYTDKPAVVDSKIVTTAHYKDMAPWMEATLSFFK